MTTSKDALEGTNRILQSSKPANGKTPSPRTLNNKNGAVLGVGYRLDRPIHDLSVEKSLAGGP